ncbi:CD44 antigen isoform X1 [Solea solea]|uniref:CD44 antigen isoform X1 n=1 Tax=Solea solea TaxID=90069 RepID=UPI00272999C1|nr:CD44 antigen isoform X1 [Solea solea]
MWTLLLGVTLGLLTSSRSELHQVNSRSCSFSRVFLVEGASRHSLSLPVAQEVCVQLETTLATPEQVEEAYLNGMETCRNGWMTNGSIAILRHSHHENCAKNTTGLIINSYISPDNLFDAYCYDDKVGPERNCEKAFRTAGDEAEPESTPTTQLMDSFDSETGGATVAPGEDESYGVIEMITTVSITPAEDPKALGGNKNDTQGLNFTVGDMDQPTGSGMLPTLPEEEAAPTTAPVGESGETQSPSENEQEDDKKEPVRDHESTSKPNGRGRVLAPSEPESQSSSDWLVIIGVIVAVAAILIVCVAVAKRKSLCGKRQTLMITAKDGGEGNGAAASASSPHSQERAQEMVTLMNKEKIQENGNTEEFTVITLEESPDKEQQA